MKAPTCFARLAHQKLSLGVCVCACTDNTNSITTSKAKWLARQIHAENNGFQSCCIYIAKQLPQQFEECYFICVLMNDITCKLILSLEYFVLASFTLLIS